MEAHTRSYTHANAMAAQTRVYTAWLWACGLPCLGVASHSIQEAMADLTTRCKVGYTCCLSWIKLAIAPVLSITRRARSAPRAAWRTDSASVGSALSLDPQARCSGFTRPRSGCGMDASLGAFRDLAGHDGQHLHAVVGQRDDAAAATGEDRSRE